MAPPIKRGMGYVPGYGFYVPGAIQHGPLPTAPPATPKPPAPAPAQAPAQPLPVDTNADNRRTLINQNLADTQAGINTQEATLKRQYGLDDPTDPFSRAQLLKQSYQNRQRGSTNSFAASGQLYAGSLQNAQNANTENYNQGYDALRKAQDAQIGNLESQRRTAIFNAASGTLDANQAQIDANVPNLPDPATLPQNVAPPKPPPVKTRIVAGKKQFRWNGNWHTVPKP